MALTEYNPESKQLPVLDLAGPEGNVFNLMGIAQNIAKKLDLDGKAIINEMKASDYNNAVYVFNREFGQFFDIRLPKGMTIDSLEESYEKTKANTEQSKKVKFNK